MQQQLFRRTCIFDSPSYLSRYCRPDTSKMLESRDFEFINRLFFVIDHLLFGVLFYEPLVEALFLLLLKKCCSPPVIPPPIGLVGFEDKEEVLLLMKLLLLLLLLLLLFAFMFEASKVPFRTNPMLRGVA